MQPHLTKKQFRRPRPDQTKKEPADPWSPRKVLWIIGQGGLQEILVAFTASRARAFPRHINEGSAETTGVGGGRFLPNASQLLEIAVGVPRTFIVAEEIAEPRIDLVASVHLGKEPIRRTIIPQETDPHMPAILEDEVWSTWLGEDDATPQPPRLS